jgi:hypothetical protein
LKFPRSSKARVRTNGFAVLLSCAVPFFLSALVFTAGCGKSHQNSEATPAPAPAAQPATPAASAPAAAPAPAPGSNGADTTARLAAADWALKQDAIKNDPNGQWAISATSSSSYNDAQGQAPWSANQTTGAPNVEAYADDGKAWAPKTQDSGIEWLDLKYPRAVYATEVRVRESFNSGTVIKVEVFDEAGVAHTVWAGNDPTTGLNYLMVTFPKTAFKTAEVKVTLATNISQGWKEIDAVQLVGTNQ